MASSEFNCKRGWLITPDKTQNGIMVPFFIKTRSKDMFTTTNVVADFLIEEYEDKIVMRRTFIPSAKCFINMGINRNSLWHTIFLPYTIKNDENFNINISLMVDYDDESIWNSTVLTVKPLFTNETRNEIYALRISATNPVSKPQYLSSEENAPVKYFLEITGLKYGNLDITYNGFYKSSSNSYGIELIENQDYYAYTTQSTLTLENWYSNKKSSSAISSYFDWGILSSGSNVRVNFYLNEELNKIVVKPVTI